MSISEQDCHIAKSRLLRMTKLLSREARVYEDDAACKSAVDRKPYFTALVDQQVMNPKVIMHRVNRLTEAVDFC
jgi:hypothetical protein